MLFCGFLSLLSHRIQIRHDDADEEVEDDEAAENHVGEEIEHGLPAEGLRGGAAGDGSGGGDDVAAVVGGAEDFLPALEGEQTAEGDERRAQIPEAGGVVASEQLHAENGVHIHEKQEQQADTQRGDNARHERVDDVAHLRMRGEQATELEETEQAQRNYPAPHEGKGREHNDDKIKHIPPVLKEAVPPFAARRETQQHLRAEQHGDHRIYHKRRALPRRAGQAHAHVHRGQHNQHRHHPLKSSTRNQRSNALHHHPDPNTLNRC